MGHGAQCLRDLFDAGSARDNLTAIASALFAAILCRFIREALIEAGSADPELAGIVEGEGLEWSRLDESPPGIFIFGLQIRWHGNVGRAARAAPCRRGVEGCVP